ncbi:MAG: TonB-dependent receptor, partial [Ignavibacteriales bacterium]|nr:TonB-dependent receptor [Ignavibacteriales bacterium]
MKLKIRITEYILLFTTVTSISYSQPELTDSTTVDSLSRKFIKPIPYVGTIDRTLASENILLDSTINFSNYRYVGDILTLMPGVSSRDFGSPGFLPDITMHGMSGRGISYLSDGIRLNDPLSGLFNLYLYPTENIERIEFAPTTRSFLYGFNSTGGTVNFITKSKKAVKPYSRIRYSESGYGFGIVDGMVSQDIIRGLNVTAGVQHSVYGERYQNENYDCWNARVKARYNISDKVNVFTSETYNQSLLGLYGGVDITQTPDSLRYESLQATVRNTDAYEKITRHDIQFGAAARLMPDSTDISTLIFYFTTSARRYRDLENRSLPNGIYLDQSHLAKWFGMKLTQNLHLLNQVIEIGAEFQSQYMLITPSPKESNTTLASIFGKSEITATDALTISPYARYDNYKDQHLLSYGGDANFALSSCLKIFGGYSRSFRLPTFQERHGIDTLLTTALKDDKPERHHLFEMGFRWNLSHQIVFEARSFHRTIWNLITIDPLSDLSITSPFEFTRHKKKIIQGIACSGKIRFGSFYIEGTGQFTEMIDQADNQITFPKWSANGGIYFWDKILSGHLDLKIGINGKYFTEYTSQIFDQQAQVYLPHNDSFDIQPTGMMDIVILGHIGNA